MPSASSAITPQLMLALELAKPERKPRVLARMKSVSYADTVPPSELVMRLSTASAAASVRRAISIASSTVRPQGWKRSKSGAAPRNRRSASGRPAASSSAVWIAMAQAASTVRSTASRDRSEVLALPRRWPKYTVMPRPLSRLYSTVSTSPRRTVTDCPTAADTSTSASLAPRCLA